MGLALAGTGLSVTASGTSAATITVATTTVAGGVDTRVLYDNAGALGEYAVSGTGSVAMTAGPTFTVPVLGVATATSLAIGGATLGANALAVTGHLLFEGVTSTGATGSGKLVFDGTPTLVTPVLGAATGTSVALTATVATGAPAGSTAGLWKLGALQAGVVTPDTTRSIFVDIGGTVYKLIVAA